jgi:hypothetical protein
MNPKKERPQAPELLQDKANKKSPRIMRRLIFQTNYRAPTATFPMEGRPIALFSLALMD